MSAYHVPDTIVAYEAQFCAVCSEKFMGADDPMPINGTDWAHEDCALNGQDVVHCQCGEHATHDHAHDGQGWARVDREWFCPSCNQERVDRERQDVHELRDAAYWAKYRRAERAVRAVGAMLRMECVYRVTGRTCNGGTINRYTPCPFCAARRLVADAAKEVRA